MKSNEPEKKESVADSSNSANPPEVDKDPMKKAPGASLSGNAVDPSVAPSKTAAVPPSVTPAQSPAKSGAQTADAKDAKTEKKADTAKKMDSPERLQSLALQMRNILTHFKTAANLTADEENGYMPVLGGIEKKFNDTAKDVLDAMEDGLRKEPIKATDTQINSVISGIKETYAHASACIAKGELLNVAGLKARLEIVKNELVKPLEDKLAAKEKEFEAAKVASEKKHGIGDLKKELAELRKEKDALEKQKSPLDDNAINDKNNKIADKEKKIKDADVNLNNDLAPLTKEKEVLQNEKRVCENFVKDNIKKLQGDTLDKQLANATRELENQRWASSEALLTRIANTKSGAKYDLKGEWKAAPGGMLKSEAGDECGNSKALTFNRHSKTGSMFEWYDEGQKKEKEKVSFMLRLGKDGEYSFTMSGNSKEAFENGWRRTLMFMQKYDRTENFEFNLKLEDTTPGGIARYRERLTVMLDLARERGMGIVWGQEVETAFLHMDPDVCKSYEHQAANIRDEWQQAKPEEVGAQNKLANVARINEIKNEIKKSNPNYPELSEQRVKNVTKRIYGDDPGTYPKDFEDCKDDNDKKDAISKRESPLTNALKDADKRLTQLEEAKKVIDTQIASLKRDYVDFDPKLLDIDEKGNGRVAQLQALQKEIQDERKDIKDILDKCNTEIEGMKKAIVPPSNAVQELETTYNKLSDKNKNTKDYTEDGLKVEVAAAKKAADDAKAEAAKTQGPAPTKT